MRSVTRFPAMHPRLEAIRKDALAALAAADSLERLALEETHVLGRKGTLTEFLRTLGALPAAERAGAGAEANALKADLAAAMTARHAALSRDRFARLAETEAIDVSAPGAPLPPGHLHITTHAIREITAIFSRLGYDRVRAPEVDWDWYVFESLNMPKEHPARDEWETFFVDAPAHPAKGKTVLTTHTSNAQVRELERGVLPIRMINVSKCYRRQADVTHVPMFHQFEGLLVDKGISVTHLKGTLEHFVRAFFGPERRTRLRPFHFRFTEPSFEVDISCDVCGGTGRMSVASSQSSEVKCKVCKEGWLELGGAGMVHPNVLKAGGVDPSVWGGFAFGWGVERTWMMKAGTKIDDLRLLYKNDVRFLEQF